MPSAKRSHADQSTCERLGTSQEAVRIWLLGGFRVGVGSKTIARDAWRLRKAAALIKLLALAEGHRLHREQVMDLLWPDLGKKAASNNLRNAVHAARKALDPAEGSRHLASEGDSLVLCPGGEVWVDVDAFDEAASAARRSRDPAAHRVAIDLYAGDLLPEDRYEEWAEGRRDGLRQLHLALLIELARLYEGREEHALAIEALRKATNEEPILEEAHAQLMRLHALSGRPEQALAQYQRLHDVLFRALGTRPAEATRRLRNEIAAGRLLPTQSVAPMHKGPSDTAKHNLPAPRTSFVGREPEMVHVKRALAMTRLLTLTGAGGTGKTRLSLEVARDLVGAYPNGVWFVELAPLSEGGLVAQEAANVLGVQERPGEPLTDTLIQTLAGKEMLLVLDNCEHVVDAGARLVDTLLASCPRLRVLATSREPLAVPGEVNWAVPPLSLPGGTTNGGANAEAIMRYEAVRLFVDRARLRLPDFAVTQENAGAVVRVCRKLEGIPLAIELATARMGVLAIEQVAERLDVSLDVLKGNVRSAAPRQQTLEATLNWSYDLLLENERALFRRLSVFAGGWTLEASEIVCSGDGIEREDVLDLLGGLVDKSLVVAGASTGGTVRYRLLEPVRQYASEKLVESEVDEKVRQQHAEFFLALAEEAELEQKGPDRLAWLERLRTEHDNLRIALSWALEREEAELALRLAGAMRAEGSSFGEVRGWLEEALEMGDQAPAAARVRALSSLKWLASWQGDSALAEAAAEESLKLSRQTDDMKEVAWSLLLLANVAIDEWGDYRRAMKLYKEGIALCREWGYTEILAQYLTDIAEEFMLQGDYERATELLDEAAELLQEDENGALLEFVLESQGWATLLRGEHEQAKALHEEGLLLCRKVDNKLVAISNLEGLACIAAARGEDTRAARMFGAARMLHQAVGYQQPAEQRALREPYLTAARSRVDEKTWEAAFAEGQAMMFEEAIEYALSEGEPESSESTTRLVPPTDGPMGNLTPREREVVVLVARGLTNRQVAEELSISERTAANHVAKILKKLRLHSRAQIASWASEIRLPTSRPD